MGCFLNPYLCCGGGGVNVPRFLKERYILNIRIQYLYRVIIYLFFLCTIKCFLYYTVTSTINFFNILFSIKLHIHQIISRMQKMSLCPSRLNIFWAYMCHIYPWSSYIMRAGIKKKLPGKGEGGGWIFLFWCFFDNLTEQEILN